MAALTQVQIDALVAKLQYYKYQVAFGEQILGPLNSQPTVEADIETQDTVLYETGSDALASIISRNNARITLEVNDVDAAMTLLAPFKKGDNLQSRLAAEKANRNSARPRQKARAERNVPELERRITAL